MTLTVTPQKVAAAARLTPLKKIAKAACVGVASVSIALAADAAAIVKLGADDGALVFEPKNLTVKAGEAIEFVNNAGFPHNIVFDEDAVPDGVNADSISAEDYLNSKGETIVRKLTVPGKYEYFCEPHQGAGMAGTITVL